MMTAVPGDYMLTIDFEYDTISGPVAAEYAEQLRGPSPYNGTLPWALKLAVSHHQVDDEYIASVRSSSGELVLSLYSWMCYPTEPCIDDAIASVLGIPGGDYAPVRPRLAQLGYRLTETPTGASTGHVLDVVLFAEPISDLDAAIALESEPEPILDMLDEGADYMREHAMLGSPYSAAMKKLTSVPAYADVIAYMRALGAHA